MIRDRKITRTLVIAGIVSSMMLSGCIEGATGEDPYAPEDTYNLEMDENEAVTFQAISGAVNQTTEASVGEDGEIIQEDTPTQDGAVYVDQYPKNGKLLIIGEAVKYTPTKDFNGNDFFKLHTGNAERTDYHIFNVNITVNAVNSSAVIGGTPTTSVAFGQSYYFKPTINDPDTEASGLSFSIAGRPYWASFNTSTGELTGTADHNINTFDGIVISVYDGETSSSLEAFDISVFDPAGNVNQAEEL